MNYLVVVAHPDDEVLGAGATIKKLTRDGHSVDICIMCSEAKARAFRPDDNELNDDLDASSKMLGIRNKYAGNFPNIEMNNACLLYTSDAADDTPCVDLGGRRIIKKIFSSRRRHTRCLRVSWARRCV